MMRRRWTTLVCLAALLGMQSALAELVRVYDVPEERQAEVMAMGDFQGLDWRENYLVLEVARWQRAALERAGFRVETDQVRTGHLDYARSQDIAAWRARGDGTIPGFACYRTVDRTKTDLSQIAADHPDLARWEAIGQTWQAQQGNPGGDDIHVLVLANQNSPHDQAPLVIMAAQHARELTTAEAAARFAEWLIDGYTSDADRAWLLDHREIHIITHQNPDGRRQVEAGESMWRKNFNENACPDGNLFFDWPGIDLNRNSSWFWGDSSSSSGFACDQTYRGTAAASEPETQAMHDYLAQVFDDQRGDGLDDPAPADAEGIFLSLHSYSELVLFPWEGLGEGNDNNAPNHDGLTYLGRKFGYYTDYAAGRDLLYEAGGTTVDYAYGEFGVAAYTFEMGTSFQQPCSDFENVIWPDLRDTLEYAAKAARRPYQEPAGPEVIALAHEIDGAQVIIDGSADDTRYFRGSATEPPADDPVFDIVEVTASLDVPPYLADQTYTLTISGTGAQVDFTGTVPATGNRVFVVATDAAGNTGVPTMVDLGELVFNNGFE